MNSDKRLESVLAVLVLYEKNINEAESLIILKNLQKSESREGFFLTHILIYDNSKNNQTLDKIYQTADFTYIHNPHNGGTAAAYSYAFELAQEVGASWLLLLDQDTKIPSSHLVAATNKLCVTQGGEVAALVPYVKHGDKLISPAILNKYGSITPSACISNKKSFVIVTAVSSGVLIRVKLINDIGPFPKGLWLDYVDHWIFLRLSRLNRKVINFESTINHHLSVESPSGLSSWRTESILNGEQIFYSELGGVAKSVHYLRIAGRILKYGLYNPRLIPTLLKWIASR